MSEQQEKSAATPAQVVRTTRQIEIGDGLHVVSFKHTKETAIMRDEPGRTFANLPTMSLEESEALIREMGLPEDVLNELLRRIDVKRKERDAAKITANGKENANG